MKKDGRKRIGILGGTFDPIHLGHIAIAITLMEAHQLDHVLFVPAALNPQKKSIEITAAKYRLAMLKIALRQVPRCTIVTTELERPGPSYMIDTVVHLKKEKIYKNADLFLLMGADLIERFLSWKKPDELVRLCPPLIAQRSSVVLQTVLEKNFQNNKEIFTSIERGITITPCFDMSATDIRQRLKERLFCGHLVDQAVLRYIKKNNLYL